jgi:hypothetical protein
MPPGSALKKMNLNEIFLLKIEQKLFLFFLSQLLKKCGEKKSHFLYCFKRIFIYFLQHHQKWHLHLFQTLPL